MQGIAIHTDRDFMVQEGHVVHYRITDKYGYSNALAPGVSDYERAMMPRWTPVRYRRPGCRKTRDGEVVRLRHLIRYPRTGQFPGEPHQVLQAMILWEDRGRPSWIDVDHLEVIHSDGATAAG